MAIKILVTLIFLIVPLSAYAADYFDWRTRTDRDGRPAGVFEVTPFPVTEASTSYSITSDAGTSTYNLGYKVLVDNTISGTSSHNYDPATRTCVGGGNTVYNTIAGAIAGVSAGNTTILVRSGTYNEWGMTCKAGTDDENRWIISGYNQERPTIQDTSGTTLHWVFAAGTYTNTTLQRLKVQGSYDTALRFGPSNKWLNIIDVHLIDNCKKWIYDDFSSVIYGDANLYFLGSDNNWIYHCTSEKSGGHGFKIGDDADNVTVEWSIAKEAGWFSGTTAIIHAGSSHPTAMDIPGNSTDVDGNGEVDNNDNVICRYNIIHSSLYYALQLRWCRNFSVHHNEIYNGIQFNEISDAETHSLQELSVAQVLIYESTTYGSFYSNIVRDPGKKEGGIEATGIAINALTDAVNSTYIYDNLIYGHGGYPSIYQKSNCDNSKMYVFNNTIVSDSGTSVVFRWDETTGTQAIQNNIFYNSGAATMMTLVAGVTNAYNVYWPAGGGSLGIALSANETQANPLLTGIPSGEWSYGEGNISTSSPARATGTDLSGTFTKDILGLTRSRWDIGAFLYDYGLWEGTSKQATTGTKPMRGL